MERKHATVIALTFVLVGLMFFTADTPLVLQQEVNPVNHESPEIFEQIADEPVPLQPLRLNVIENPSFENFDFGTNYPTGWYAQSSTYANADPRYTDVVSSGTYAGLVEGQGNTLVGSSSYLYCHPVDYTNTTLLEPGISLSFDWNSLANPDINTGAEIYSTIVIENATGDFRTMRYYLSTSSSHTNISSSASFLLNDTLNQWNSFDRNITEDFIAVFGSGDLSNNLYVTFIYFQASSPIEATGIASAVFDVVVLYNSTYIGWIENGNFETGTGAAWYWNDSSIGYVTQSTDSTLDTYSLNMSIPTMASGSAYTSVYTSFPQYNGYHVLGPNMNTIELDWKYNDTVGAGADQSAYLKFVFQNASIYEVYFYFGYGDDNLHSSNKTTQIYVKMPGFGSRDIWQHSEIDLFDICNAVGFYNLTLTLIDLRTEQGMIGSELELLVDDFRMITYPGSDPTFEYDNWNPSYSPFMGWDLGYDTPGVVTKSTESHSGSYACNITTTSNQQESLGRYDLYVDIDSALMTDFWWRMDHIQSGIGMSAAYFQLGFIDSGTPRSIAYILGNNDWWTPSNATNNKFVFADGFNQTGIWTNLARNITNDIESLYLESDDGWYLDSISIYTSSAVGLRTSFLIDDVQFTDTMPPTISGVIQSIDPVYYEVTSVVVTATDTRPGVSSVVVNYTTDGWSSWNTIDATYGTSTYDADIPAQPYGTTVQYFVIATDGVGLQTIDNNGGLLYSYTVDDDVDPTLRIDTPVNNTAQEGLLAITATASDPGSGVEYVSFNVDGSGPIKDYTAPYSQNWNLDDASLGSHFIIVSARDNAGHTVSLTHYITVVDTIDPGLDSPGDVAFTVGAPGPIIDWNPTDIRPASYEVFVDTVSTYTGLWNHTSEHLVMDLDGLAVGTYNYTCVVADDGGNTAVDTVIVTVSAEATTPTTTTTTTTTPTTSTTPTGTGDIVTPLLIVISIGGVGILLVVFVVLPKMKKT
ncbi:MAG: hypothetical protein E4H14_06630 [Candidatus Thorarchaeota archaeon]|nr:MAG: hypothetical protein E4H14_06630 [Candidatus Thorarchaeota archaeon]